MIDKFNPAFLDMIGKKYPCNRFSLHMGGLVNQPILSVEEWAKLKGINDETALRVELLNQLGHSWRAFEFEGQWRQIALILLVCSSMGENISEPLAFINQWAVENSTGKKFLDPNEFAIMQGLQVKALSIIKHIGKHHAWSNCVAQKIAGLAKSSGNHITNSNFLWLAKYDRVMWLLLSSNGRREPPVEIWSIVCHTLAEEEMRRSIEKPRFNGIADVLMQDLDQFFYSRAS